MSKMILVAETGSDLPENLAKEYGVRLVPMHVAFGSETRDDGSFDPREIYDFFERTGTLTQTSGCTVGDFEEAFRQIRQEEPDARILHLAYSAVTTCSYQSAVIASEGMEQVVSVDTKFVSAGQALIVILTARWLREHPQASLEEAQSYVQQLIGRCRMGFFPGDLAYLKAGGRVSNAAYMGAKILSLNPLIELKDGYLKATKKYRGNMKNVAPKFMREFIQEQNLSRDILAFVYSQGIDRQILEEAESMAKDMGFRELLWIPTGGVITTHCGPGGFGIAGIQE